MSQMRAYDSGNGREREPKKKCGGEYRIKSVMTMRC